MYLSITERFFHMAGSVQPRGYAEAEAPEEVKPMDAFQVPKCAEPVGSTGIPGIPDIPYPKRPCKYGKIVINHGMNWVCLSFRETVFFMENDDDKL